jgi:hypothetical protein
VRDRATSGLPGEPQQSDEATRTPTTSQLLDPIDVVHGAVSLPRQLRCRVSCKPPDELELLKEDAEVAATRKRCGLQGLGIGVASP